MPYAAYQDAKDRYGEDYVHTSVSRSDTPDLAAFDKALLDATDEINTYAGVQYTVPFSPVPSIIVRYCIDIAIYQASADAGTNTDEKRKRYEDALSWLKKLAAGDVVLDVDGDGATDDGASAAVVQISGPTRVFSRSSMDGL